MWQIKVFLFVCVIVALMGQIQSTRLTPENFDALAGKDGEWLTFYRKGLTSIDPMSFKKVKNDKMELDRNNLTEIPADFFRYNRNFERLSFKNNSIAKIDTLAFFELRYMAFIFLSHNRLEEVQEDLFTENIKLLFIYLDNNRIKFIHPNTFSTLTILKHLSIGGNHLKTFDINLLAPTKELRGLHLDHAELLELDYMPLRPMFPKLVNMVLNGNYFNCSFSKTLAVYLRGNHIDISEKLIYRFVGSRTIPCIDDQKHADILHERLLGSNVTIVINSTAFPAEDASATG